MTNYRIQCGSRSIDLIGLAGAGQDQFGCLRTNVDDGSVSMIHHGSTPENCSNGSINYISHSVPSIPFTPNLVFPRETSLLSPVAQVFTFFFLHVETWRGVEWNDERRLAGTIFGFVNV